MRFLEFLSFGRKASTRPDQRAAPRRPVAAVPANLPPSGSVSTAAAEPSHEKRRHRTAGSGTAPQWRPTLGAISEEQHVLRGGAAAKGKAGGPRPAGKGKMAPSGRGRGREKRDDYSHVTAPAVIPAFAPTAFLF